MLNEASKQGILEILSSLEDSTLLALASTITTGLLKNKIIDRNEATVAILNYSPDALSFLRRKTVTREILFAYLHRKSVPVDLPATKNDLIQKIAAFWDVRYTQEAPLGEIPPNNSGPVELLAEQFTRWFYTMINKGECINHEHFYLDARIKICTSNNNKVTSEVIENDRQRIVQKLHEIRVKYDLIFNPNMSGGGIHGKVDPHGLVMVLVCGTLHAGDACVGIFEQVFGLVRDPQCENNWKIKTSELNLTSQSGVVHLPTLEGSKLLALMT